MKKTLMIMILLTLVALFVGIQQVMSMEKKMEDTMNDKNMAAETAQTRTAVFAGGCFWCTESDFEKIEGVIEVVSGYAGGHVQNPTYKQVSGGGTGHIESVKVTYDPDKISYDQLLDIFWRKVDPTDPGGQFVDRGDQYRSVIFYADASQKALAQASKMKLAESGIFKKPIVTDILPLETFYPAEDYHQDYYKKNPLRYKWYRSGSGRDQFLKKTWMDHPMKKMEKSSMKTDDAMPMKKEQSAAMTQPVYTIPDNAQLRRQLTPLQYQVVRENGTERAFDNAYWDNHAEGIYVDIVSGEPLFSSTDKFESGTGWPSFTRPLVAQNVIEKSDESFFMVRTEVRSKHADSHLGHVFNDGPPPTGLRYCINSAALRFVPKNELQAQGLGQYLSLFNGQDAMAMDGKMEK